MSLFFFDQQNIRGHPSSSYPIPCWHCWVPLLCNCCMLTLKLGLFSLMLDVDDFLHCSLGSASTTKYGRRDRDEPGRTSRKKQLALPQQSAMVCSGLDITSANRFIPRCKRISKIVRVSVQRICPFGVRVTDIDLVTGPSSNLYLHSLPRYPPALKHSTTSRSNYTRYRADFLPISCLRCSDLCGVLSHTNHLESSTVVTVSITYASSTPSSIMPTLLPTSSNDNISYRLSQSLILRTRQ